MKRYALHGGVDGNFVFPLEFSPHGTKFSIWTVGRMNVIEDVDMNFSQIHKTGIAHPRHYIDYRAEYGSIFCRCDLR